MTRPWARMHVGRRGACTTFALIGTGLLAAQVGAALQPTGSAPTNDPPPVTASLATLDALVGRVSANLPTASPQIASPAIPAAKRAQAALARLRELSANWPAQSPVDYRSNLDRTARELAAFAAGTDQGRLAAFLDGLADDLETKLEHCVKSGGKLGGSVTVRVRTVREGREVPNWQVYYLPRMLDAVNGATADRFPQLSSPTQERLVPGRYAMWSSDPASGRLSTKTIVKVGEGRQDLTVDLAVPGS